MRYALLADDINHTCLYFVEADDAESAIWQFLADESPNEPEENRTRSAAKASYLRFEVHEVKDKISGVPNTTYPVFCSDDQIYDVEPLYLDNHLARRHTQLGMIYLSNERWSEAVAEFLKASALNADVYSAGGLDESLAKAYIGLGDTDSAIAVYKNYLARTSPNGDSHGYYKAALSLAKIYRGRNDHAQALANYESYLEWEFEEGDDEPIDEYLQDMIDYVALHKT